MDTIHHKNNSGKIINRVFGELTHGESQELYTLYLLNSENSNERLNLIFQFCFYFVLVSAFLVNVLLFFGIVL